ncbi:MAG TPA: nicotinate-nucleotide--dimethylbenzimidazole phosphoribosyltransferase [Jiangellales bacterium]|nr:nicotinate-nucleotide--dimethylbenzimidazole phosphoribosyltransferase [Jiangellales bacterium]
MADTTPGPLDLVGITGAVDLPDEDARAAAQQRLDSLAKPPGALGRLEELAVWLAGVQGRCPTTPLERVRVVVVAGDHGIAAGGVSAYPPEVTALMVRAVLAGGAAVNALARVAGATVRVVDLAVDDDLAGAPEEVTRHKVRRGSGRIDVEDALTAEEAEAAFRAGIAIADEEVDAGADLLVPGDMGIGNTTPASTLVALLTGTEVVQVIGRGTGIDDEQWMRKCAAVRDAARRGRPRQGDMLDLLAAVGGADLAAMTGLLLRAAARRTPVVLDGLVVSAAALVAQRLSYRVTRWFVAGHRSAEPAHTAALTRLGLTPLVEHGMRLGEGTGALVAVPQLRAAAEVLGGMATLDEVLAGGSS